MARLQKVFTSADLGNGLCLLKISELEDLSHPPHKQSGQPDVMFFTLLDQIVIQLQNACGIKATTINVAQKKWHAENGAGHLQNTCSAVCHI